MYQAYGKPLAWLLTIAKNLCYMKLRGKEETVDELIATLQKLMK